MRTDEYEITAKYQIMSLKYEPFTISVPEADIEDLRERVKRTRWPDSIEGVGWSHGTPPPILKDLASYWANTFDWRVIEANINTSFSHFTTAGINGLDRLHFIHQKSPRADATPMLLIHGWPGSIFEVLKIIKPLTNPDDPSKPAFHVVAPSIPGFGFSSAPKKTGFGMRAVADTFNKLMIGLGYHRYFSQGGDWGMLLSKTIGMYHSDNCKAIHLNTNIGVPTWYNPFHWAQYFNAKYFPQYPIFGPARDIAALKWFLDWVELGNGYAEIQSTRPQTLGYGLTDSPIGLLAWILEKFYIYSDIRGDFFDVFSRDEILANVSIYWFTENITSSFRIYYEARHTKDRETVLAGACHVPTGIAAYPVDINTTEWWAQSAYPNLKRYCRLSYGGHFPALQTPDSLVYEIQQFFQTQTLK